MLVYSVVVVLLATYLVIKMRMFNLLGVAFIAGVAFDCWILFL